MNRIKMMPMISLSILLTGFTVIAANAVEVKYGPKIGIGIADLQGADSDSAGVVKKYLNGYEAGVTAEVKINDEFSLQPELLYSQKGAIYEFSVLGIPTKNTWNVNYFEIPLLAKGLLPPVGNVIPNLFIGPYLGVLNSSTMKTEALGLTILNQNVQNMESTDYGLILGGGVNINLPAGDLIVDFRYTGGLKDIRTDSQDLLNSKTSINFAFTFK